MNNDLKQLLQIWDHSIEAWQADKSSIRAYDIAESALSQGAYFEAAYHQNVLLETIHQNFGLLEVPGPDNDPNNAGLWKEQAELVKEAHKLLGINP